MEKDSAHKNITDEILQSNIFEKKILFTHASVGYNILDGVRDILGEEAGIGKNFIKDINAPYKFETAGLYHTVVGENGAPKKKIDGFREIIEQSEKGNMVDVAFLKLCYVDIQEHTDIEELFNYYSETMDYLMNKYPDITFIHVTTPLYAHGYRLKSKIKSIIKGDLSNVKRNRYNKMLVQRYGGENTLFDLAGSESSRTDGSRTEFSYKGQKYYALSKEYTDDGGHLNTTGRVQVAVDLLRTLTMVQ